MSRPTPLRPVVIAEGGGATRTMFIRGLTLDCSIGVHRHERDALQRVHVDIELEVRDDEPVGDDIAKVVSYDDIVAGVKAIAAAGHINLVETLAERIGAHCVADPRVVVARVRVEKPGAIADAQAVGVAIERVNRQR